MFVRALILVISFKILLLIFANLATFWLPVQDIALAKNSSVGLPYWKWVWGNFDGVNYMEIARAGYQYPNYAYFPLYPLLISFIKGLTPLRTLEVALLISQTALFLSLLVVYKIARLDFDKIISWRSTLFLLALPVSFFYTAGYADSLFLLLSAISFYAARRSQWFIAGLFGFLAGLCRLVGIALLPVLLLEWYTQKQFKIQNSKFKILLRKFFEERVFFLFLIPLGIISYGLYLQVNFGDFLLFQKSMVVWSQEKFVFPLRVAFRYMRIFLVEKPSIVYLVAVVEFVATFIYLALSIYVLRKIRASYGVFMLLVLLIPAFTGTFQSMPRYILHLFPACIALAVITAGSKRLFWGSIAVFLILQFIFVAFFTRGYFIA